MEQPVQTTSAPRNSLTRRELLMSAVGALLGLVIVGVVWVVSGQSAQPALPAAGELNRPAPAIDLPGPNGSRVNLADYRGRVVLVNFWATWCEPCKEETPALVEAYQKLEAQGLTIIGVNLRRQEKPGTDGDTEIQSFLNQFGVRYPIAFDVEGEVAAAYQISPIPVSYFIDPSGTLRYVRVGTLTTSEVEALFGALNREQASR